MLKEEKDLDKMIMNFVQFDEPVSGSNVSEIEILKTGVWDHPTYGKMTITQGMLDEFIQNFNEGIRKGICITEGHPVNDGELPAVGWFKELKKKGSDALLAVVEWNKRGMEILADKVYKFFSPEFFFNYEDPETRTVTKNVLTGGALTNKPYFKSLEAVVMSEKFLINNKKSMKLEEIISKKVEDVTKEEMTFMESVSADLDEETQKKFSLGNFKKKAAEDEEDMKEMSEADKKAFAKMTPEEKKAFKAKKAAEKKECDEKAALAEKEKIEAEEKAKIEASEKEKKGMSETEIALNTKLEMAEKEIQAFKMREKEVMISGELGKVIMSETNKLASFLPKTSDAIKEFAMSLGEEDCKKFFEILGQAKKSQLFSEDGSGADSEGKNAEKAKDGTPIDAESQELSDEASRIQASEKVSYEEALVMAEKKLKK